VYKIWADSLAIGAAWLVAYLVGLIAFRIWGWTVPTRNVDTAVFAMIMITMITTTDPQCETWDQERETLLTVQADVVWPTWAESTSCNKNATLIASTLPSSSTTTQSGYVTQTRYFGQDNPIRSDLFKSGNKAHTLTQDTKYTPCPRKKQATLIFTITSPTVEIFL